MIDSDHLFYLFLKKLNFSLSYLAILLITMYRLSSPHLQFIFPIRSYCIHSISCSVFTIQALKKHSFLFGSLLSIKRIFSCIRYREKHEV